MKTFLLVLSFATVLATVQAYDTGCGNDGTPGCEGQTGDDDGSSPGNENQDPNVGSNPIDTHRGCLMRRVVDIQTFGAAPIVFMRHYSSRTTNDYTKPRWELGTQFTWQHNWQYEIRESSTADYGFARLILRYPQGREQIFQAVDATGGTRVSDASWGDRLYMTGAGTFTLRTPQGREYDFQKTTITGGNQYLLTQVRNGTGWKWTLTYQSIGGTQRLYRITNNYGRYLQIARTAGANGYYQITSVTANDGRAVTYGYGTWSPTSETVLTSVTYPDSTAAAYTWCGAASLTDGPPLLASANDPMNDSSGSRMKYVYNYTADYGSGNVVNGTILEERNLVTDKVIVSLPLGSGNYPKILEGNGTEITRKFENGLTKEIGDGEGRTTVLTRDAGGWGYVSHISQPLGGSISFTNDYAGRVLTRTDAYGKTRTYTYYTSGFLHTETDEKFHTTTYTRGTDNRVSRIDHPDGTYETFTYTGTGLRKTHRLRSGFSEIWTYDGWGNLATHTDAAGKLWVYTCHPNGLIATVEDPRHYVTGYLYNWRGNLTKITHPDTSYRDYTYTNYGKLETETDELGHTWTSTYTEYNQLKTKKDPLNHLTAYEYGQEPGCGSCAYRPTLAKITLPSGKVTEFHHDRSGLLTSKVVAPGTADESTTGYAYDAKGRLEYLTDPRSKVTHYTYDLLDRKKTETDPLSHTTQWDYDDVGNVTKVTRADTTFTTNTYDAMDRLLTTTNPKSETTTYTYHADDTLWTLKDARNSTYTYAVDALSRRTRLDYPGGSYETWTYDDAGNMTLYRARNAATKTCVYNNRNFETSCDWSDTTPDTTKTYDFAGRLGTLTSNGVALTYTYTNANELQSETYGFGGAMGTKTVSYTYDADGNRATLTYPDGTLVEYGYTGRNQVVTVSADGPPPVASFTYDAAGNRLTKTLENGVVTTSVYNDASQLASITHKKGTTTLASAAYEYNSINLRTRGEGYDAYLYDAADQLTIVGYADTEQSEIFSYDAAGNRTSLVNSGTTTYAAANALNQYSTFGTMGVVNYDTNGNTSGLQSNNAGGLPVWTFTYDSANRLVSGGGGPPSFTFSFVYDGRNRALKRVSAGTTTYQLYDDWNLIAEFDISGNLLAKYIHGPHTDEILAKIDGTGTVYYHENGLGSTIALSDATGIVVEQYRYDVFGKPTFKNAGGSIISASAYGNRFLFTGREWFSRLQLYDYRNRMYSPEIGRFLQTDPIRFNAGDVNIYRYVLNNSVNKVDPTGTGWAWEFFEKICKKFRKSDQKEDDFEKDLKDMKEAGENFKDKLDAIYDSYENGNVNDQEKATKEAQDAYKDIPNKAADAAKSGSDVINDSRTP